MNTSKKWRKPLFRQAVARRLSEAAGLIRRPGSGAGRAAGRSLRRRKFQRPGGAAAFGGPGAQGSPGLPNKSAGAGAKGPGPALSGRFASCRRPPRAAGISINAKGQRKNPAFRPTLPRSVLHPEKAGSDPLSRATAPGQPRPPGRDYRRGRSTGVVFSHI